MMKLHSNASEVLVTVRFFDEQAVAKLEARGHRVLRADIPYDGTDQVVTPAVAQALSTAQAWIIGMAPVTDELLRTYPNLKVIARRGVGFDTVDVSAIEGLGRLLTNTPGGNEPAVADHAVGLMLAVGKKIAEAHSRMKTGEWRVLVSSELYQKTVGLVGLGRIGRQVASRLSGFDCKVLAYDPFLDETTAKAIGVTRCSLEEVLTQSDYVSLHAPLTPQTHHLISAGALSLMKHGAILINTARGELIDEEALLAALNSGLLAGAGLDVFACEHDPGLRPLAERLIAHPHVVATPHSAASSDESLQRSNKLAAECVALALEGKPVPLHCIVADGRPKNLNHKFKETL